MALVDEAERFVEQRTRSFEVMLEGDWTVAVCVYVAPDRLQHAMGSSLLPSHPSYPRHSNSEMAVRVRQVFSLLDAALARLHRVAGEGTTIVLMSDHGFRPVTRALNLNLLLAELGLATRSVSGSVARALTRSKFARLAANTAVGRKARRLFRAPSTVDWSTTVAYESATGGGISLNLRGREPAGIVDPERYHETRDDVRDRLLGYRDPETDEAPITGVRTRDEIPSGPFQALAPDLIAFPAPLWVFAPNGGLPAPTAWPSGAHRSEGVIAAAGRRVPRGHLADHDMPDLAATALAFAGVPATGLDGRTIEEIAGRLLGEGGPSRPVISRSSDRMSPREEDEVAQHLRNLGYIE
jgi:predicted AlkP superfamily phosphohydrolase/phosphomutase